MSNGPCHFAFGIWHCSSRAVASEDPDGATAADRRRRVHDTARPCAAAGGPGGGDRASFGGGGGGAPVCVKHPDLDEIIIAPRTRGVRRIADDLALARRLRRERFDLALDLHGGPRSAWLTWASGARERIGYDITGRRWMYTRVVHRARDLRPGHAGA